MAFGMKSSRTHSMVSSQPASIGTKLWMLGSMIVETTMTIMMWAHMPIFFKLWSVICLAIDLFMIVREFVLHPINERRLALAY